MKFPAVIVEIPHQRPAQAGVVWSREELFQSLGDDFYADEDEDEELFELIKEHLFHDLHAGYWLTAKEASEWISYYKGHQKHRAIEAVRRVLSHELGEAVRGDAT